MLIKKRELPIGIILQITPHLFDNFSDKWKKCDGSEITDDDSPLKNQLIPNLNNSRRFLRGNDSSGGTGGNESHNHNFNISEEINRFISGTEVADYYSDTTSTTNNIPYSYSVVYIMKIK